MKKERILLSLLIVTAIAVGLLAGGCFGPKNYSESDSGETINTKVGKQFTITVRGNATTGYTWQMAKGTDETVVKKVGDVYTAENGGGKVGVGGTHVWTFKAVKVGTTKIKLQYLRAWEKPTLPANILEYKVKVTE